MNPNLMVATLQIDLRENGSFKHPVQYVIQSENGEPIFNGNFIDGAIINVHPSRTIFLQG